MNEIFTVFIKLGTFGFGGPVALIGMMEEECVRRRQWLSILEFQKMLAVSKVFPGPIATLMAVRIGKLKGGTLGGILSGACLILPSFFMVLLLSHAVTQVEAIPSLAHFVKGLTLAALAISTFATIQLTKPLFQTKSLPSTLIVIILFITAVLTYLFPTREALFMIGFGFLGLTLNLVKTQKHKIREIASPLLLFTLFFTCFKASLLTFGSGIAIVPVLRTAFIDEHHWLTNHEFLKGLTLGQVTPGPLIIITTYLGYLTANFTGAVVTTLGTFTPTFILGLWVIPKVESTILNSERLKHFFQWLIPAVCGAIFGSLARLTLLTIAEDQHFYWGRMIIILLLVGIMIRFRIHSLKILLLGGIFTSIASWLGIN